MSPGAQALERQLRAPAPGGVQRLGDAEQDRLAGYVRAARHRQAAELEAAGDKALVLIPRILRGPVRRMLG